MEIFKRRVLSSVNVKVVSIRGNALKITRGYNIELLTICKIEDLYGGIKNFDLAFDIAPSIGNYMVS